MAVSSNASAFAKRYFGSEWESFLLRKGWVASPTDNTFHDTVARAFDLLNASNQQKLISFITQVKFNDGKNHLVRILLNIVFRKDYSAFYDRIYNSLEAGKYTYNDLCLAFLEIIEAEKADNSNTDMRGSGSANTRIKMSDSAKEVKPDDSVIDVTGQSLKIEYATDGDNQYSHNPSVDVNTLPYLYDEIRLGTKYKEKLGLTKREVEWLNKFWNPNNVFLSIEGCCIATIRFYLIVMKDLNHHLELTGTSLQKELDSLFILISKEYGYYRNSDWSGSYNNYYKERTEVDIFWTIFKKSENAIRSAFRHKRKLEESFTYNLAILEKFDERIGNPVDKIIEVNRQSIQQPDDETIIDLNQQNTGRWKPEFEELEKVLATGDILGFVNKTYRLADLNRKNPSVENIFFEASKVMAKTDRIESVKFYLNYLYADLKSAKIDNKQLTKTIQKALFKTNDELQEFEKLVSELLKHKNIDTVIEKASTIFLKKRKKIQLDSTIIKEVKDQHSGTVELLNEFLEDEYDDESTSIKMVEAGNDEIQLRILSKENVKQSEFLVDLNLSDYQESLLKLFEANDLRLFYDKLDLFSKDNGLFKNQLVDSINEKCFDLIDDVLIEDENGSFTINRDYFYKLKRV